MLLPILLLQTNINQILDKPCAKNNDKGLFLQIWNFIEGIITQCYWQPIPTQIYYLPHFQSQNPYRKLDNKDNNFLAFGKQKKTQTFQDMTAAEKQELLAAMKADYRQIIIN
ncbi:KaiA family protein, partial [Dolichospermum sp. LEGE 00246]|nr:KaiA family protein [Dolichospermum sp. LEGE 00246]